MAYTELMRLSQDAAVIDRDQVQLALAIADTGVLRSLLTDSTPAVARSHQVGQVRIEVGVPTQGHYVDGIDGVVEYEQIRCAIAQETPPEAQQSAKAFQSLTRCHSELKTLAWRVNLAEAISLLHHGGFNETQIQQILQLPWDAWHRSWWHTLDPQGGASFPFQRWFRSRSYSDGKHILQYRDYYPQDAPPCFHGIWRRVPLVIANPDDGFGELLKRLRSARQAIDAQQVILLSGSLSDLEQEGFIRQGISLYPLQEGAAQREHPACATCRQRTCPFYGRADAPVMTCSHFQPNSSSFHGEWR